MLSLYFSLLLVIVAVVVAFICYSIYGFFSSVFSEHELSEQVERRNRLVDPTLTSDTLRMFIIDYLDDNYSPIGGVSPHDRLMSDVGVDSLDMHTVMDDVGHVTYTNPSADDFFRLYGHNASVSDLISYIRSLMVKTRK